MGFGITVGIVVTMAVTVRWNKWRNCESECVNCNKGLDKLFDKLRDKMDVNLDPFSGEGILHSKGTDMDEDETEYKCSECGADWEGKSCFGYVNPICSECGTVAPQGKEEKK